MVLFLFQYPPLKSWLTLYIGWGHNSNVQWVPRCSENKLELWKSEIQCNVSSTFCNGLTVYQLWLAFTKIPKCLTKQLKHSLQLGNPSFLKELLLLCKLKMTSYKCQAFGRGRCSFWRHSIPQFSFSCTFGIWIAAQVVVWVSLYLFIDLELHNCYYYTV